MSNYKATHKVLRDGTVVGTVMAIPYEYFYGFWHRGVNYATESGLAFSGTATWTLAGFEAAGLTLLPL